MAILTRTPPALAGERSRSPAGLYARAVPMLEADEPGPGTPEPWHFVAPVRPDTPHVRALRFLDTTADLISAALIIGGDLLAYGHLVAVA